jgi:hypothetical protein
VLPRQKLKSAFADLHHRVPCVSAKPLVHVPRQVPDDLIARMAGEFSFWRIVSREPLPVGQMIGGFTSRAGTSFVFDDALSLRSQAFPQSSMPRFLHHSCVHHVAGGGPDSPTAWLGLSFTRYDRKIEQGRGRSWRHEMSQDLEKLTIAITAFRTELVW